MCSSTIRLNCIEKWEKFSMEDSHALKPIVGRYVIFNYYKKQLRNKLPDYFYRFF